MSAIFLGMCSACGAAILTVIKQLQYFSSVGIRSYMYKTVVLVALIKALVFTSTTFTDIHEKLAQATINTVMYEKFVGTAINTTKRI